MVKCTTYYRNVVKCTTQNCTCLMVCGLHEIFMQARILYLYRFEIALLFTVCTQKVGYLQLSQLTWSEQE